MGNLNLNAAKLDLAQSIANSNENHNKANYMKRNSMQGNNTTTSSSAGSPASSPSTTTPMRQHPIELGLQDPSLITPYLLLGGVMVNKNPELAPYLGITHVINMAIEIQPTRDLFANPKIHYKHIRSDDSLNYNIRVHFEEAFEIIDDARSNNGRVLVHCMMGISRSATIVIAYLMSRYGMTLRQAYTLVKQRRPEINPNPLFFQILEEFERELMHARLMMMNKQQRGYSTNQFNEYASTNQHQQRSMMRSQNGAARFYTLKPSMYGAAAASSSIYNQQRSTSPMPMMSGAASGYSPFSGRSEHRQPYAF